MTTIPTTISERVPLPMAAPPPMPAGASKAITPGDVIAMIRQRLVTIIGLWLLFGSIGIGLFFLAYFKFPLYSAFAYIECISDTPSQAFTTQRSEKLEDAYLRFVQSQALYIKSYDILSNVLKDAVVRETTWFKSLETGKHLKTLEEELGVSHVRDTNYIRVSMSTRSMADPHKIVNTVVNTYLTQVKDSSANVFRQELAEYKRERQENEAAITAKQGEIRTFVATLPPGEIAGEEGLGRGVTWAELSTSQEDVNRLTLQTQELESLVDLYADPNRDAVTPEDRLTVEQDPRVSSLEQQVFNLEQEMNIMRRNYGENHREFQDMKTRLDEAQSMLDATRRMRLAEIIDYKEEQVRTAFFNSQHTMMIARERLQEAQAKQADLERKLAEYQVLQDDLGMLIRSQNRLDEYIQEIDRIVRQRRAILVQSAVRAADPLDRSFPTLILLPVIVMATLAMAVGLALGLELLDTSVKTTQDITRHLQLALLGSIPDVDDEEVDIQQVETAVIDSPQSMVTEAFRTLRSNLQFSAPADRLRSILVTSPRPEDGRTTVAVNLAASLASSGKRVLLVDGNFRRPALHRIFAQLGTRGMTNVLVGEATISDCVTHTSLPNLDVIGSGPVPPNPAELLGGDLCRRFVREVTGIYDHVLFDSPPVLLASDASVLATLVDGTILVFRAKDNSRGVAARAISLLRHVNAHLFGGVLNGAQARRGGYFREQLRTFYEYHEEEEADDRRALPDKSAEPEKKRRRLGRRRKQDAEDNPPDAVADDDAATAGPPVSSAGDPPDVADTLWVDEPPPADDVDDDPRRSTDELN